ncbi:hypothetical protein ESCO_003237 [Escovopsis weberi]|uniref:Uncharacterized protein n=1 Tax=Escovopsis weberi TaxID=150374 RepID=A0A0M8MTR3_ESCWE|nr:hypothetical protein ESCO_003237 [Escovopsis weberi]
MARIPPLLQPYLGLRDEGALVLLTGVQGAGTNWLGLDLDSLARLGRVSFVDGLTGLYTAGAPSRSAAIELGKRTLRSDAPDDVRREIGLAVGELRTRTKVLILDGLDEWLAMSGDEVTTMAVEGVLLSLRELVHTTVLALAADYPLVHGQATELERSHAALVLAQAHAADAVLGLRMLDTGVARDVSGVMRISERDGGGGREYLYHVGGDGGVRVFERGEVRAR